MSYPFRWSAAVFENFLEARKMCANKIMIERQLSYDDVIQFIQSDQVAWRAFKKAVHDCEKELGFEH